MSGDGLPARNETNETMPVLPASAAGACMAANALQSGWFNRLVGGWLGTDSGGSACAFQATVDLMHATRSNSFAGLVSEVHRLRPWEILKLRVWGSHVDALMWAGAYLSAYDVLGGQEYLESAQRVFDATFHAAWDESTCGGGLWQSTSRDLKSSVAGGLALWVSAALHNTTTRAEYLDASLRIWRWFNSSGIISNESLVSEGIDASCQPTGQTAWTHTQGIMIGGLVALHESVRDPALLEQACRIADAALDRLTVDGGILKEHRMPERRAALFKGIFARHLARLATAGISVERQHRYIDVLRRNAESLFERGFAVDGRVFSAYWEGPVDASCRDQRTFLAKIGLNTRAMGTQVKETNGFKAECPSAQAQISALMLLSAVAGLEARGRGAPEQPYI